MRITRREFVKILAGVGPIIVVGESIPDQFLESLFKSKAERSQKGQADVKFGMVIDLDLCIGCGQCVRVCRRENNVPRPQKGEEERHVIAWMNLFFDVSIREGETSKYLPRPCMQCEDPPCTIVCPVKATYKREEDGLVVEDYDRCIGCRYCMTACPYDARSFNWSPPETPSPINPKVPLRPVGVIEKCTYCVHRIDEAKQKAEAEGRELRDEELLQLTACAEICPVDAIFFGNLADPNSTVSRLVKSKRAIRLAEELGTHPMTVYLKERAET